MSTTEDESDPLADPCGRRGLPPKVSRLRAKLSQKAKLEPKFRFYALYDRLYRFDVLQTAWSLVRKTKTAPGVDGVTFRDIEDSEEGVRGFLESLQQSLRSKSYKPDAVRRVHIPKPDGRTRPLGIPTVCDRIVQMAALLILEPIFEADFRDSSFGFRPGRGVHDALDAIRSHLGRGKREVYDADLKGYFDTIPHDKLIAALEVRISDRSVLRLIRSFTMRYERSILPHSDRYLHVGPSSKAMDRVRQKLRELTSPHLCFKPAPLIVSDVNRLLAGWSQYFGYGHPRRSFAAVTHFAFRRLCVHLRRRSQRGCRPPGGRSLYDHLYHSLGFQMIRGDVPGYVCSPTKRLR